MSRGRFFCRPINKPTAELTGSEAHHLASVLRAQPGEQVELFACSKGSNDNNA